MKQNPLKYIPTLLALLGGIAFVVKFGEARLLKTYIEMGLGSCAENPVFCKSPQQTLNVAPPEEDFLKELLPYKFPKIELRLPKGFTVTQECIIRPYYKRKLRRQKAGAVYLLHQEPGFFPGLFPELKRRGILTNYDFVSRTMSARLPEIKTLSDAFFVIMKGIFTPGLGDQQHLEMTFLEGNRLRGFINYNLSSRGNYFDCNIITAEDGFFKIYIKDKERKINLDKMMKIISTLREPTA